MDDPSRQASPDPRSVEELAAAAARGDEPAFGALRRRFAPGLHRLLLGRAAGREDVAEDLAQATWVSVWQALRRGQYDPARSAISTFVYAVGHKTWLQYLRRAALQQRVSRELQNEAGGTAASDSAETTSALAEAVHLVRECLRGGLLSAEEVDIVIGAGRGESDRDLAARLNMASSTINAKRRSAYEKIRRALAQRGFREDSLDQILGTRE